MAERKNFVLLKEIQIWEDSDGREEKLCSPRKYKFGRIVMVEMKNFVLLREIQIWEDSDGRDEEFCSP